MDMTALRAYLREQLATIDGQEAEAKRQLIGLAYARQAYQDVLNELDKTPTPDRAAEIEAFCRGAAVQAPSIPRRLSTNGTGED